MRKLLAATMIMSALTISYNANSHDKNDGNINFECDVEFNHQIDISPEHIRIIKNESTLYDIYQDSILFRNGEIIELVANQQILLTSYSLQTREIGPAIASVAMEGVELAVSGLKAGFANFDEEGKLDDMIDDLRTKLTANLNQDTLNYSYSAGEFNIDVIDEEFDVIIEDAVEEMVPQLMGSVFKMLGAAMMAGDTELSELENIGDKVEQEIEARAHVLEAKADSICGQIKAIDKIESELQQTDDRLSDFNSIRIK